MHAAFSIALGFARPLPAMSGALPWIASNMLILSPMFALPAMPTLPVSSAVTSLMMSP